MILTSFWRKKSTYLYLIILTILFLTINILFIAREYIDIIKERQYLKTSLVVNESMNDNKTILESFKDVKNLKRALYLRYKEDLNENILTKNSEFLTYSDESEKIKLKDNEIIIRLSRFDYMNKYTLMKKFINQNITFDFNGENISLIIKDIISDNSRTEILISNNLFQELINSSEKYIYSFGFVSEEKYNKFCNNDNDITGTTMRYDIETTIEHQERETLESCIKFLTVSIYFINIIFIVMMIIVNKNIITDFTKNMKLEYKLGFKKRHIKFNTMKCLLSIHLISFALVFIANLLILLVTNYIIKAQIDILDIKIYYILFMVVLIIDGLLCISNKTNIRK